MSDAALIIAEIIAGIAVLGLLSAVITYVMVRLLSPTPPAVEILQQRYARGELTREQYMQMQQDLGLTTVAAGLNGTAESDGRDAVVVTSRSDPK